MSQLLPFPTFGGGGGGAAGGEGTGGNDEVLGGFVEIFTVSQLSAVLINSVVLLSSFSFKEVPANLSNYNNKMLITVREKPVDGRWGTVNI